jgi:hypothetical protein
MINGLGFLAGAIGIDLPLAGVTRFPFGTAIVTSVGMLGNKKPTTFMIAMIAMFVFCNKCRKKNEN